MKEIDADFAPEGCKAVDAGDSVWACDGCCFRGEPIYHCLMIRNCWAHKRPDGRSVIFVRKDETEVSDDLA